MEELTYPDEKHNDRFHPLMATAGSNIVNKGGAFGIGANNSSTRRVDL